MAYDSKGLVVESNYATTAAGQANTARRAIYMTPDAAAVVEAVGYFNSAAARLPKFTMIEAVMATGGTPVAKRYIVTANTGTVVTIALQATAAG